MAGTVSLTTDQRPVPAAPVGSFTYTFTGDAATGAFPTVVLPRFAGFLQGLQTNPGSPAPTANYDITLVDQDGVDRFNAVGIDRHTSNSERVAISGSTAITAFDTLTLTLVNNSVASAITVVTIYWSVTGGGSGGSASTAGLATSAKQDTLAAQIPTTLGQTTKAGSLSVTIASDQVAGTATRTDVASSSTTVTVLAATSTRKGFRMTNDSNFAVYLKYGTTASSTDYTVLLASQGVLFEDNYTGRVDGIWTTANGNMRVTELT